MLKLFFVKVYSLFFCFLFCFIKGYAQTYIYERFGVDEGLPSSEVYDAFQDKLGYIWFATDKGLSRYNGYEFENFTSKDGLPGNTILDFYPQKNGEIWCYEYHSQSLFYFKEDFNGFMPYKYNDLIKKEIVPSTIIKSIHLDTDANLIVGGYGLNGFIKISNSGNISRYYDSKYNDTINSDTFRKRGLGILKNDNVFGVLYSNYKTDTKLISIDIDNTPTSRIDFTALNENHYVFIDRKLGVVSDGTKVRYYNTDQNPTGVKSISDTTFFVGYYSTGAEIRDVSGTILERFLPNKSVSNLLIDAEGGYWFCTLDDGVYYIKNPNIKVSNSAHITSLVKDDLNNLYAGFHNGNIERIVDNGSYLLYQGLNDRHAFVEFDSNTGQLYGYSDHHIVNYSKNESFMNNAVRKLPEHIMNPLVSSESYSFSTIENDSIHIYNLDYKVQDVCYFNNNILIGTSRGLFIQKNRTFSPYQNISILKSRIDDIDVNSSKTTAYMATQGEGVVVYGDSIYNINSSDGLTDNIVSEIHVENDSTVWACTNSGLNRITFKPNNTYNIATITKADGLLSNDIDDIEIINNTVWVATKKGLCFFNKNVIQEKENAQLLSLQLKTVSANRRKLDDPSALLAYNDNALKFELQAISLKHTKDISYLYRLKEVDTNWTFTKGRTINFPSLPPGTYTFEAKASVFNNINSSTISYNFKILPPFWKRWWFYGIYIFLFFGLVYLFFRVRVLSYNKDVFRELIRLVIKRLKRKEQFYKFRANGEDFKIPTHDILYINSQGNYLDVITKKRTYTIRCKIGDFINSTPDPLEYLRLHRSYIIRIDQVSSKGKNWVVILDEKIPVGETYLDDLDKIQF